MKKSSYYYLFFYLCLFAFPLSMSQNTYATNEATFVPLSHIDSQNYRYASELGPFFQQFILDLEVKTFPF